MPVPGCVSVGVVVVEEGAVAAPHARTQGSWPI